MTPPTTSPNSSRQSLLPPVARLSDSLSSSSSLSESLESSHQYDMTEDFFSADRARKAQRGVYTLSINAHAALRCADALRRWGRDVIEIFSSSISGFVEIFSALDYSLLLAPQDFDCQSSSLTLIFFYHVRKMIMTFGELMLDEHNGSSPGGPKSKMHNFSADSVKQCEVSNHLEARWNKGDAGWDTTFLPYTLGFFGLLLLLLATEVFGNRSSRGGSVLQPFILHPHTSGIAIAGIGYAIIMMHLLQCLQGILALWFLKEAMAIWQGAMLSQTYFQPVLCICAGSFFVSHQLRQTLYATLQGF